MSEWCKSIKLDTVKQQTTPIDVLFANAGIIGLTPLGSVTEDYFDKIFSVNVNGILFTVQKAPNVVSGRWWIYHPKCFDRRIQRDRRK